jgi:hypothetical protein
MYLPDSFTTVRLLTQRLATNGLLAFQELDMTMVPARLLPLHERAFQWLRGPLVAEGADLQMGLRLYDVFARAGMIVEGVRAEAIVQTPGAPSPLGSVIKTVWPRIVEHGVATAEEIDADTI